MSAERQTTCQCISPLYIESGYKVIPIMMERQYKPGKSVRIRALEDDIHEVLTYGYHYLQGAGLLQDHNVRSHEPGHFRSM